MTKPTTSLDGASPAPSHPRPAPKIQPATDPPRQRAGGSRHGDDRPARSVAVLGAGRILASGGSDARIAVIASQQRNRVSRRQLLAAGVHGGEIDHRIRTDRLFTQLQAVYAVGSPARVQLGRETSALLAVHADAMLSHESAARLWGLMPEDDDAPVHVTVGDVWIPQVSGVHGHRSRILAPADRRVRARLPVCSAARVLLDLAARGADRELERTFDEARIAGIVTSGEILELLRRAGRHRGVAALRELSADAEAGVSESEAETRLDDLLGETDLPPHRRNARVAGYRLDFWWERARFAVEVDGFRFHSSRRRFESDRVRDARLAALGIEVMRITWRQLEREPLAVIARIAAAVTRRSLAVDA